MKFTTNGYARKNGFRFELKYGSWLHGEAQEKPWFLWMQDTKNNEGTYTEHTHRFANEEEAAVFCEKVATGEITISQLKAEERGAWDAHKNKVRMTAEAEAKKFLHLLSEKDIDLTSFIAANRAYFNLDQEARNVLFDEDAVKRLSADIASLSHRQEKESEVMTLEQYLTVYQNDIDICVWDTDTGEHVLPCLCYLAPEDVKNGMEYEAREQWLLTLPIDHIIDRNGCPMAVLKTDFNYDQTCFLLGELGIETVKWANLDIRANCADADFNARLAFLKDGTPFETPFDANSMDAKDPMDREEVCKMLKLCNHVYIVTDAEDQNALFVYGLKEDHLSTKEILWNLVPELPVVRTEPGEGLASTLEGKMAWAEHLKNKESLQRQAPQRETEKER